jgi:hypothetical protein
MWVTLIVVSFGGSVVNDLGRYSLLDMINVLTDSWQINAGE